jgi:hypothetical protein
MTYFHFINERISKQPASCSFYISFPGLIGITEFMYITNEDS